VIKITGNNIPLLSPKQILGAYESRSALHADCHPSSFRIYRASGPARIDNACKVPSTRASESTHMRLPALYTDRYVPNLFDMIYIDMLIEFKLMHTSICNHSWNAPDCLPDRGDPNENAIRPEWHSKIRTACLCIDCGLTGRGRDCFLARLTSGCSRRNEAKTLL